MHVHTRRLEAPEFTRLTLWCLVSVIEDLSQFVRRPRGRAAIAVLAIVGLVPLLGWLGTVKAPPEPGPDAQNAGPAGMPLPIAASSPPARTGPAADTPRQAATGLGNEPPLAPAPPAPIAPSFDIVRVEPNGDSVIAGRAAPGATVELLRDGEPHFRTLADESGHFAIVPSPLPPGSHTIVLQSVAPDGTRARSRGSVTVAIADNKTTPPLVALSTPDKPTMVLSNPDRSGAVPELPETRVTGRVGSPRTAGFAEPATTPVTPASGPRPAVRIAAIDAEEGGRLFVSGEAAPGATVRLYLNETLIAPGAVGADGKLAFAINRGVKPGSYRVRLDDVDPVSREVKSRAEVPYKMPAQIAVTRPAQAPFTVPTPPQKAASPGQPGPEQVAERASDGGTVLIPEINTAIVARGDNLWRISHRIYGDGLRYTVIYGGNQDQIRDPNLIYPGQSFVLPPETGQTPRG
jgi:nucleoid-associated protein YgaU